MNFGLQSFWGITLCVLFCFSTGFSWHSSNSVKDKLLFNTPTIDNINTSDPTDCDINNGSISIEATGTGALEYSIDGGMTWQGFNTFLNLGAGNYAVQVRMGTTCVPAENDVVLIGPNSPEITDIVTNDPAGCDIQNGVIVISASGGQGEYQFSIDNGQNWQNSNTFQGLSSGAYQIAVQNLNGTCFVSGGITTLNGSADEPQIEDIFVNNPTDCGQMDGVITIILSNSSGNFEYSNDGGVSWQEENSFADLAEGDYNVLVRRTDMTCTVTAGNIEIVAPTMPVINGTDVVDPTSCNVNDGSIVIDASPGLGALEYSINGGISWMEFNTFVNQGAGDYQIAVRNLDGSCQVDGDLITLEASDQPSIDNVFQTNPSDCVSNDGEIIVTAIPCGSNSLQYSIDNGATYQPTGTFSGLGGGIYEVLVRNTGETQTVSSGSIELIAPPPPVIDDISSTNIDCTGNGGSITIQASGNAGFLEYSINGTNWQAIGQFDNLPMGDYTPFVRYPNSDCFTAGNPVTLSQMAGLTIDEIQTVEPSCGQATGSITIVVVSGLNLEFSIDGGVSYQASNFFGGLTPGLYNPAVQIVGGDCETMGDPITLQEDDGPDIQNVTFSNPSDCGVNDGSITITATSASGDILYSINGGDTYLPTNEFINLSPGTYNVFVQNGNGSCPVEYALNPLSLTAPAGGPMIDEIIINPPSTCGAADASMTILASGNPVIQYSIDGGMTFEFTNTFNDLAGGNYDIVLQFPGSTCTTEETVMVGDEVACDDIINVTIPMNETTEICLGPDVLQISGTLTDTEFCNQGNPNTVFAPIIDNNCVSLAAQIGFAGLSPDTICTIHCYDNDPALCDTTYIVVTVDNGMSNCDDVFSVTEITQDYSGNPTEVCIPLPILEAVNLNLILNGNAYNDQLFGCMEDSVIVYSYAPLTGNGFNGPYTLNSWSVGGMVLTNMPFADANDLLAQMNAFDPAGMWEIDTDLSLLISANSTEDYGFMDITHDATSNSTVLQPNETTIANGTVINVPNEGINEFIVINPDDGCADTLLINLEANATFIDTIFVSTTPNTPIFDLCATGDDIPGGAQTVGLFQVPNNGGIILTGGLCGTYSPNLEYLGKDTFGLVACNNVGQTLCDSTVFIVCVVPPADVLTLNLDDTNPIDTCLTDLIQLPNGIATAEICGINDMEVTAVLNDDCINIDPEDDFMGSTEICVVHCDADNNCDTTTIIVNVNLPCPDIFPANFLGVESSEDPVPVCVSADSMTLANLVITLDGTLYDIPLESCVDDQGNPGTTIYVPGGSASHELLVMNPDNGCSDNLTIIIQAPPMSMLDTIFVETPQGVTVDEICGNALDLPGNAFNVGFCELPDNGAAPVVNDSCVAYIPGAGFVGNDDFCMIICDDLIPSSCDSFIVIVSVLPPLDTVAVTAPTVAPFDTCLTSVDLQLQANIATTEICNINTDEVNIVINDNCVTIDVEDNFTGTTEACIIHCYDIIPVICDTTILVISNDNMPCPEIFNDTEVTVLADVDGNAELCIDIPFMEFGDYQINLNGQTYIGLTDGCNILGGVAEGTLIEINGVGDYVLTAEDLQTSCTDTLNITVMDGANVIEIETELNTPSEIFCIDTMDLIGNFDTLMLCDLPMNGILLIDENCFTYLPNNGYLGADEATVKLCDDLMNCDTFMVQITVNSLCGDFVFLQNDTLQIPQEDCNENGTSCLPIPPNELIGNYNILDNGFPYDGGLMACDFDTCLAYSYFNLPGMGSDGPYELTSWLINGSMFMTVFDSLPQLVDSMNVWDNNVMWNLDPTNLEIKGCGIESIYSDLEITQQGTGATSTLDAVPDFVPNGTEISLETGVHELIFIDILEGCTDTLLTNVFCDTIADGCGNMLLSDAFQLVSDCDSTAELCIDISIFDIGNFVVNINGDLYEDNFLACSSDPTSIALELLPGEYELIFNDTVKACMDTYNVTISCQPIEDIVIDTVVGVDEMLDICLEDLGFPLSVIDSVVNTCADQTTGNVDFAYDEITGCVTLLGEVIGADTACYKMYLLDTCATVFINATVQETCDAGFFSELNYGLGVTDCDAGEAELCLPVLPLEFENVIVTVGGAPYTGDFLPCDETTQFSYPYSAFPLGGADVDYIIDSLLINDVSFTGVFDNIEEFVDSLNTWDPGCGWEAINQGGIISVLGGCMDSNYGPYSITHQILGLSFSADAPEQIFVPNGVAISLAVGVGQLEVAFIDTLTNCTDTIIATLACVQSDTMFLEVELGMTDTLCLDTMDLPGAIVSISNACEGASGEFVSFDPLEVPCVAYSGVEQGTDLGCIVVCDDLGVCDTTYLVVTTIFDGLPPVAENDDVITGINQVIVIDFLCSNDENIDFLTSVEILTEPENGEVEIVVDSTGTCLYSFNFAPDEDYCGNTPEMFTYEICNTLGCDTATVFVSINCTDIMVFNGFSPNNDPNGVNEHFEIRGLNTDNYPGHIVRIFNRWGNRVYETEMYENNPWTGQWDNGNGTVVPDGTYFYVIDLGNGQNLKGYVQLHR